MRRPPRFENSRLHLWQRTLAGRALLRATRQPTAALVLSFHDRRILPAIVPVAYRQPILPQSLPYVNWPKNARC